MTESNFQKTRGVLIKLIGLVLENKREDANNSEELWKIYVDNTIEEIETIYNNHTNDAEDTLSSASSAEQQTPALATPEAVSNKLDSRVQELLANLVWGFTLIKNGVDTGQYTLEVAGKLERAELKVTRNLILELMRLERVDELLGADDEIRLHNTVSEHYQKWFTERSNSLQPHSEGAV